MEQRSASSANIATPAKRKRSSQACRNCRVAKRKCDAARPSCSSCANSSATRICIYDDPEETRTKQSKLIERLQQRITDLEHANDSRKSSSTDHQPQAQHPVRSGSHQPNGITTFESATQRDELTLENKDVRGNSVASSGWYGEIHPLERRNVNLINSSATSTDTSQPTQGPDVYATSMLPVFGANHSPLQSPHQSSTNASRAQIPAPNSVSASIHFEHSESYLGQDKEFPPNDEIGVVEPRYGYFGDSSAVTFMSQVRSVLDNATDWAGQYETEPASPALPPREPSGRGFLEIPREKRFHQSKRNADFELYTLPSREHADALLEVFWTWVHSLYPYLDRPDFEQKYEKIWLASKPGDSPAKQGQANGERKTASELGDRKTFYCTLNIVFALSCQFDPTLSPGKDRSSDVFWQRAKTLIELDFNIFNEGSIPLIQAMLLFVVYMQSTDLSGGCWITANVATSVAQVNGLHQINSGMFNGSLTPKELDLRKRVWSGCIVLDRSLSMIYGRPSIMTSRAWIGEDLNPSAATSQCAASGSESSSLSYSEFFHHHSTLHDILGAILSEFYEKPPIENADTAAIPPSRAKGGNPSTFRAPVFIRRVNEGDFQSLLRFDTALLRWKSQLPAFLRVSFDQDDGVSDNEMLSISLDAAIAEQQAAVLHARFLHIRILLFRPLLLRALADFRKQSHEESTAEEKSTLHEMLLMQSSVLCISAAQELSKLITKNLQRENSRLPEWWHIIFYLYTCATVILASRCCPPLREKIGEAALQSCWTECVDGLRVYQECSLSARRCCRLLELFDQRTKNGQPATGHMVDARRSTAGTREEPQVNARSADMADDFDLTQSAFPVDGQNQWPFYGFQSAQSADSLDAYFNSWTPNSTDMAILTAIPFDSGLYSQ